jgi:hypothetical protein
LRIGFLFRELRQSWVFLPEQANNSDEHDWFHKKYLPMTDHPSEGSSLLSSLPCFYHLCFQTELSWFYWNQSIRLWILWRFRGDIRFYRNWFGITSCMEWLRSHIKQFAAA